MTPMMQGFTDELIKTAKPGVIGTLKKVPVPGSVKHLGRAAVDIAPWLALGYVLGRRKERKPSEK